MRSRQTWAFANVDVRDVEAAMAMLGPYAWWYQLQDQLRVGEITSIGLAAEQSPDLEVEERGVRWKPGALHCATLRLAEHDPDRVRRYLARRVKAYESEYANQLRLATYLNDDKVWAQVYQHLIPGGWVDANWPDVEESFLLKRIPCIRAKLLGLLSNRLWTQGEWSPALQEAIMGEATLAEVGIQLSLAQGKTPPLSSHWKRQSYDALQAFLMGLKAEAHALFSKRLARRKAGIPALTDFLGIFARLAALSQGDVVAMADPRLASPGLRWLDRLLTALAGHLQQPVSPETFAAQVEIDRAGTGLDCVVAVALRRYLPVRVEPPPGLKERLRQQGLTLLADQLEAEPTQPWLEGRASQPWRMWLQSLRTSLANAPPGASQSPEGDSVLAWHLYSYGSCTPYRHSESGSSYLSVSSLLKKPPDFLSLQDRIVLGKFKAARHGEPTPTAESMQALVGHPRVFYDGRACELVEEPQKLKISRGTQGLTLAFQPSVPVDKLFVLRRAGSKVMLTVPSPWHPILRPLLDLEQAIPSEGEEELRSILGSWCQGMPLHYGQGVDPLVATPLELGRLVLRITPRDTGLRLNWCLRPAGLEEAPELVLPALSGPEIDHIRSNGVHYRIERDHAGERAWLQAYQVQCPLLPTEPEFDVPEPDAALELLEQLQRAQVPLEWTQGSPWRIRRSIPPASLCLRALAQGEWFRLEGELRVDESLVLGLGRALELARQFPGRYLSLGEGDFVRLEDRLREQLNALDELVEEQRQQLQVPSLVVPALASLELPGLEPDSSFLEALERFDRALSLPVEPPATLQAELRDYQEEGYRWLARLAELGAGACLADDMGLGKTLQALALLVREQRHGPHLVICPTSVTSHWCREISRFAPTLSASLYEGKERESLLDQLEAGQVLVLSYRLLLQDHEVLTTRDWNVALLDEAQMIKNPDSKTARACYVLRARVRVATTGTPVENRLSELWSIFNFLNPGLLGTRASFRRRFETPIGSGQAGPHQRLRRLVAPFLLRRLKSQVLGELPPRTELTLEVELSAPERALYEKIRREAEAQACRGDTMQLLAHLTRLRQACCHPRLLLDQKDLSSAKVEAFLDLMEELQAGRHRALVFSQFTSLLDLLEAELESRKLTFQRLDGSTPAALRRERVARFQEGIGDLFLLSLKAGGTGLNLTAADYVVHLDPWWNPAVEDQASDRAHRLGQTRPVTIYRILARNTIEEKVMHLHGRKRELAQSILEGRGNEAPLNLKELRELLRA